MASVRGVVPREHCQAVIPCLNEAGRIGPVVAAVWVHVGGVVVIDDGSTDGTAEEARAAGATVIRHPVSAGKGAALRAGWRRLAEAGIEWALCLDGDGQHEAADAPGFLEAAGRTGADLVVGNRFATPGSMPWIRRATNRVMSRVLGAVAGRPLPDSQCGFRLLRLRRLPELRLSTDHYEVESEMLLAAVRAGWRIEFVPVATVYRGERSKIRPLADSWRWARWVAGAVRPRNGGRCSGAATVGP